MDIPSIPSDNLYKFIALASLITLILAGYFLKSLENEIIIDLINYNGDLEQLVNLKKDLADDLEKFVESESALVDKLKNYSEELRIRGTLSMIETQKRELEQMEKQSNEMKSIIDYKQKESAKLDIQVDTKNRLIENQKSMLQYVRSIYSYSVYLLSILMVFGFLLWYQKVQRHQDKILKYQADSIKSSDVNKNS